MATVRYSRHSGQALIVFGIFSLVIIGFVALVTDGGIAFVERRKAQSASDLVARAGALAKGNGKSDAQIYQAMSEAAVANGYPPTEVAMTYVDSSGGYVANVGAGTPASTAAGVRATVTHTYPTFFSSLLDRPSSETTATAAMTIGSLVGFTGGAPIIVCANATPSGGGTPTSILLSDGSVDPAKVGMEFEIWGNGADDGGCNPFTGGGAWKGLANDDSNATAQGATCTSLPCPYGADNGTQTGPTKVKLGDTINGYNGCDTGGSGLPEGTSGCILLAPVGDMTSPCAGTTLTTSNHYVCVKGWALFELTDNCSGPNCRQTAILRGNGVVLNGSAGSGGPGANTIGPKAFAAID